MAQPPPLAEGLDAKGLGPSLNGSLKAISANPVVYPVETANQPVVTAATRGTTSLSGFPQVLLSNPVRSQYRQASDIHKPLPSLQVPTRTQAPTYVPHKSTQPPDNPTKVSQLESRESSRIPAMGTIQASLINLKANKFPRGYSLAEIAGAREGNGRLEGSMNLLRSHFAANPHLGLQYREYISNVQHPQSQPQTQPQTLRQKFQTQPQPQLIRLNQAKLRPQAQLQTQTQSYHSQAQSQAFAHSARRVLQSTHQPHQAPKLPNNNKSPQPKQRVQEPEVSLRENADYLGNRAQPSNYNTYCRNDNDPANNPPHWNSATQKSKVPNRHRAPSPGDPPHWQGLTVRHEWPSQSQAAPSFRSPANPSPSPTSSPPSLGVTPALGRGVLGPGGIPAGLNVLPKRKRKRKKREGEEEEVGGGEEVKKQKKRAPRGKTTLVKVVEAIDALKDRKGATHPAIKAWVVHKYPETNIDRWSYAFKSAVKTAIQEVLKDSPVPT
ncbi:hypothetical protein AAMO2058_000712300 [Amorphochlora amoebiformis]